MTTEILGILASAIAAAIIGFTWYHPKVFGGAWMRLSHLAPERIAARNKMPLYLFGGFIGSLMIAFVLSMQLFAETDMILALARAFWLWLGFVAPVLLGSVLWEGRSWKLYLINVGYWLVTILVMAAIITLI